MSTTEENKELIETLKGPKFYRITINGYGGESAYMGISKEAFEYWHAHTEEHGDSDLVDYMLNAQEEEEFNFQEMQEVPTGCGFLTDEDGQTWPWYESHTEFEHSYGAELGSSWISVEEVVDDDYNSDIVVEIINEEVSVLRDNVGDSVDWESDIVEMNCCDDDPDADYIAQLYSSEKGCFFDGRIETIGIFDPKKLKIHTTEYLNNDDTITEVYYDGVVIDNDGGSTNGKGYYASVWEKQK